MRWWGQQNPFVHLQVVEAYHGMNQPTAENNGGLFAKFPLLSFAETSTLDIQILLGGYVRGYCTSLTCNATSQCEVQQRDGPVASSVWPWKLDDLFAEQLAMPHLDVSLGAQFFSYLGNLGTLGHWCWTLLKSSKLKDHEVWNEVCREPASMQWAEMSVSEIAQYINSISFFSENRVYSQWNSHLKTGEWSAKPLGTMGYTTFSDTPISISPYHHHILTI